MCDNCDIGHDTHTHARRFYLQSEIIGTISVCVYRAIGKYQWSSQSSSSSPLRMAIREVSAASRLGESRLKMRYVSDIQAYAKVLCAKVSLQTSLLFENCSGEHGTDRLSRNVGEKLPLLLA
jgi:hypothetical protein